VAYLPIGTTEHTNGNGVNGIAEKQLIDWVFAIRVRRAVAR
jgi:hypothetical protein